jgi:hypothetical protein
MFVIVISNFTILTLYCINVIMYWINLLCNVNLLLLLFHNFHLCGKTLILFVFQSLILFTAGWRYPKWTEVTSNWPLIAFVLNFSSIHFRMSLSGKNTCALILHVDLLNCYCSLNTFFVIGYGLRAAFELRKKV